MGGGVKRSMSPQCVRDVDTSYMDFWPLYLLYECQRQIHNGFDFFLCVCVCVCMFLN